MPFQDFENLIVALDEFDIVDETTRIIGENSDVIVEMVRAQLAEGKDRDGNENVLLYDSPGKREGIYAARTVQNKRFALNEGAVTDRFTNYMTGNFYYSMYTKITGDVFEQKSDVAYFEGIIAQNASGVKIMELNDENLRIFSQDILVPQLKQRLSEKLNR